MITIDGKPLDLTNPKLWGGSMKILPNGYIEQRKDGVTTRVESHQPWCDSLNKLFASLPPQPAPCNCKQLESA